MLEQEAREKAVSTIYNRRRIYCPMIRQMCLISCECFKMPEVYNADTTKDKDSWVVSNGYCACHALKGPSE